MNVELDVWGRADADLLRTMRENAAKIPDIACQKPLRIGVVGYSDNQKVKDRLKSRYWTEANLMTSLHNIQYMLQLVHGHCTQFELVSGLTDTGVPGIAYHHVKKGSHNKEVFVKTVGFACEKAKDFLQFPVDEKHIIGKNWGDESEAFLQYIDGLIRIGNGDQSIRECEEFKRKYPNKPIIEIDDDRLVILGDQP